MYAHRSSILVCDINVDFQQVTHIKPCIVSNVVVRHISWHWVPSHQIDLVQPQRFPQHLLPDPLFITQARSLTSFHCVSHNSASIVIVNGQVFAVVEDGLSVLIHYE